MQICGKLALRASPRNGDVCGIDIDTAKVKPGFTLVTIDHNQVIDSSLALSASDIHLKSLQNWQKWIGNRINLALASIPEDST